jgi:adenylate cyclase
MSTVPMKAFRHVALRFLNPLLMVGIAAGSFVLLGAYLTEMDPFSYASDAQRSIDNAMSYAYLLLSFLLYFVLCLVYERPIHEAMRTLARKETPSDRLLTLARLRAMNAPVAYAALTAMFWMAALMLFPFVLSMLSPPVLKTYWATTAMMSLFVGAFMTVLGYFAVSAVSRIRFLPALFPHGHLDMQPGGHSLSLRGRTHLVFVTICALPVLLAVLNAIVWRYVILDETGRHIVSARAMAGYQVSQSISLSLFCLVMGFAVVVSFGMMIGRSIRAVSEAVEAVHRGDLSAIVRVDSRDEIGLLGDRVNEMIIGLRERKRIVEAFNRYVDRTLTRQVLEGEIRMGGIQLEVSIIFCDIRGYTSLSEGMEPDRIVAMLNRYFTLMAGAVEEEGGTVNKFIGDAILAVFGAPQPCADHRDRAIRAALAMYRALGGFNAEQREDGQPELKAGIGIHSGLVLAGNIGTANKIEYTVIGDAVNVAQRIEELTAEKGSPIICSGATLGPYKQRYAHEALGIVGVKGRTDTLDVYSLMPACERFRGRNDGEAGRSVPPER